jgi:hypothetical protein
MLEQGCFGHGGPPAGQASHPPAQSGKMLDRRGADDAAGAGNQDMMVWHFSPAVWFALTQPIRGKANSKYAGYQPIAKPVIRAVSKVAIPSLNLQRQDG